MTENARHFLSLHRELVVRGDRRHGLVLFSSRSFTRHRPDLFVRAMVRGLDALLADLDGGPEGRAVWLRPAG